MTRTQSRLLVPLAALALVVSSCGGDDSGTADPTSATAGPTEAPTPTDAPSPTSTTPAAGDPGVEGSITVFAATSLTDALTDVGEAFTAAHPDASVEYFFEGSSTLATQIIELAPADVFASADLANMDKVVDAGLTNAEPVVFATNLLTIIVEPGNPLGITGVDDLADPDVVLALCEPEQPCRNYSDQIFAAAGMATPDGAQLANVGAVTNAVRSGEADAGIVYVTNVIAAGSEAEMVEIPEEINVPAEYPIALLTESGASDVAEALIEFILGADGQAVLRSYGFGPPS